MSEYFGKTAFGQTMQEVRVKQPPPRSAPMSMKAIRKQANKERREHRKVIKAAKQRMKNNAVFARIARANTAEHRESAGWDRKRARAHRRGKAVIQRHARAIRKIDKAAMRQAKQAIQTARASISRSNKAIRQMKRAAKPKMYRAARQSSGRGVVMKATSLLSAWRQLKRLMKPASAGSFRNHGYTGSGKGGRTGRAGFHSRGPARIRTGFGS